MKNAVSGKKIVIKVGTNVITRADGSLDITSISHLVDQIAMLKSQGHLVVLVTSGAVGAGRAIFPEAEVQHPVVRRQLYSAIGQIRLMEIYRQLFWGNGLHCGQILATKSDFNDRPHYLNMRNCLLALLDNDVVPVVNENDTISITELMFTDNDELAGLLAGMLGADMLVILSSVNGLYNGSPEDPASELITTIATDDTAVLAHILPQKTSFGRGGMETKLRMAQRTARLGIQVVLANGRTKDILPAVLDDTAQCTRILPQPRLSNLKKWMLHTDGTKGKVYINAGALEAIRQSKSANSLLPIGITNIEGDFKKGDLLQIISPEGQIVGLGMAQYNLAKALDWMGQSQKKALIHYDYMVLY